MSVDDSKRGLVFPAALQNLLAAFAILIVVTMTGFLLYEYVMLSTTPGDVGYPFGSEEAGAAYATKEVYLARGRWLIAIGGTLSFAMVHALWRKRMVLLWGLTLLTIFGALFLFLQGQS
jgi:hypothetical protein